MGRVSGAVQRVCTCGFGRQACGACVNVAFSAHTTKEGFDFLLSRPYVRNGVPEGNATSFDEASER